MARLIITPDKKEEMVKLWKSLRDIDSCIQPFQEQKKELRELFVKEKGTLSNEEFALAKKAYTFLKNKKIDFDDFSSYVEIFQENMTVSGEDDGSF